VFSQSFSDTREGASSIGENADFDKMMRAIELNLLAGHEVGSPFVVSNWAWILFVFNPEH
jgi:hypothetical protein